MAAHNTPSPSETVPLDDILSLGRSPVEVSGGRLTIAPRDPGQMRVVARFVRRLERFVRRAHSGELLLDTTFILDGDPAARMVSVARAPDLAFVARARVEAHQAAHPGGDSPWWLAPDLAVEVLSPTASHDHAARKAADYLRHGVTLVWMVDPSAREVRVYSADTPAGQNVFGNDKLTAEPLIAGWAVEIEDIFGR
jgi:Uma2 family endonuclease